MQAETASKTDLNVESPESSSDIASAKDATAGRSQANAKGSATQNGNTNGQFPPPKTDKPRPHVCGTCGRSFARLEHLKRHERSHTKEKPFECPECTRCFARRDLLLRHQQKLHMTTTTSSRPRSGRRESVSSSTVSGGRVRKNSIATGTVAGTNTVNGGTHRPRANTLGHIDLSGLSFMDLNPQFGRMEALGLSGPSLGMNGMNGLGGSMNFVQNHLGHHGLSKLDTQSINTMDVADALRTAPPYSLNSFDIDQLFSQGTTINPAQLHFGGSVSATQPTFPALEPFTVHPAIDPQAQPDDFGWMRNWNMQFAGDANEQAIDESSPSRISSGDSPPEEYSESMTNSTAALGGVPENFQWAGQDRQARQSISSSRFQLDALGSGLPNLDNQPAAVSPDVLQDPTPTNEGFLQMMMKHQQQQPQPQSQPLQQQSPGLMSVQTPNHHFAPSLSTFSDSPSMSSSSMTGSGRHSSVTSMSVSTDSITDATRQALLMSLSHNNRKYSQPTISSPLSPGRSQGQGASLPSTDDIRRYVNAFVQYAHPHLPFMHISTLSFEFLEYSGTARGSSPQRNLHQNGTPGLTGGAGCLILGMAAIGALYEYDHPASRELFDAAKKVLTIYLEERRKADMSAAVNGISSPGEGPNHTPLWLVQATLLSVVYGHQCGDKTAADIASHQFAALISLARSAELTQPPAEASPAAAGFGDEHGEANDIEMRELTPGDSISRHQSAETDLQSQWLAWKAAEERKRTLFAIFIISSLLTTAYNHTPTIMNSEILLDLPCDEELWSAESAQEWQNRGGLATAEQNALSFAAALSSLLTASQRQGNRYPSTAYNSFTPLGSLQAGDVVTDNELRPSTFGCLVLINALHNYIWETRSRHSSTQWTPQETQSMFSHIEPALNAWQAAWRANDHHKLQRPNPYIGAGPLSADCVPLLDLAFVRLFVNLGQSKEAFWRRDFDAMADELARGSEIVQHADGPPLVNDISSNNTTNNRSSSSNGEQSSSRRERHLRKAAFYAADSLIIACDWNLTYADMSAHELPVQSAMCFFDCCQVLAEWACTVQERVGRYLGVLGRDAVDFAQVPAIMMLEAEDVELLRKMDQICDSLEAKRVQQESLLAMDLNGMGGAAAGAAVDGFGGTAATMSSQMNLTASGYGSKILRVTAMMLEKAVVWPVTHVMAKALETQASHMDQRAESSTVQ